MIKEVENGLNTEVVAIFRTSVVIGVLLVRAGEEEIKKMVGFVDNVGVAFQIKNDILGVFGEEKVLGKSVYSDIKEGKKTILVLHALQYPSREEAEELRCILGLREKAT